jgi:hypothetical protein
MQNLSRTAFQTIHHSYSSDSTPKFLGFSFVRGHDCLVIPREVQETIVGLLDSLSCFNLAVTSIAHWDVCHPFLDEFGKAPVVNKSNLRRTLLSVLENPENGEFITKIDLTRCWEGEGWETPEERAESLRAFHATSTMIEIPPDVMPKTQDERIEDDDRQQLNGGVLAVLIHHLPRLEQLRMSVLDDTVFDDMLCRIANDYGNKVKACHVPLQRLETVVLCHNEGSTTVNAYRMQPFLGIPSLRKFSGLQICGSFKYEGNPEKPWPTSNIEEIILYGCNIDERSLGSMFACTRRLKSFTYFTNNDPGSKERDSAKTIVNYLKTYASHSLQELTIQASLPRKVGYSLDICPRL